MLTGMIGISEIIEFHEVRKRIACPTARCYATLAPLVKAIDVTDSQRCILRLTEYIFRAKREGVNIHQDTLHLEHARRRSPCDAVHESWHRHGRVASCLSNQLDLDRLQSCPPPDRDGGLRCLCRYTSPQ